MRNTIRNILALAALASAVAAGQAEANSRRRLDVVNTNASVSIESVWSARAGHRDEPWHTANLEEPIEPRSSSHFTMPEGPACFFDVKVQFSDDTVQTFSNVNVCRGDRVIAD